MCQRLWKHLTSGISQGCSIAPLLYILSMEALLGKIRTKLTNKGLQFKAKGATEEIRVIGFVDDLVTALKHLKYTVRIL